MKLSGEQIDDRIVEVHWDPQLERWRMMRFRDDKPHGNFRTVVHNIMQSIADGVEKSMVSAYLALPTSSNVLDVSCSPVAQSFEARGKRVLLRRSKALQASSHRQVRQCPMAALRHTRRQLYHFGMDLSRSRDGAKCLALQSLQV